MNQIFERTVERPFTEVFAGYESCTVESQTTTRNLVTDGKHTVSIRPDIQVRDEERDLILVGDAKWKLGRPSNSDLYQMASYQFTHDVLGILIYPEKRGDIETQYSIVDEYSLALSEFPIPTPAEDFGDYVARVRSEMNEQSISLLGKE